MDFRIADTFTDSLAKLTGNEQKAAKTTAFDLQLNPAQPGLQFHKVNRSRDPNFWSVRVSRDVRIIVHRTEKSLMLCYVDHHDKAYHWAERRRFETHPKTGAAQLIEVREIVQEIVMPVYVETEQETTPKTPLLVDVSENDLLSYGVPTDWIEDVRNADEDSFLELVDCLPSEAGEALLELAVGGTPTLVQPVAVTDPFEHPDAQRRFILVNDKVELERALEYPWEKWALFLHPTQRQVVEKDYSGPFRVSGVAGTGKTVVAIHRAVYLARANPDSRVLLTTFSDTLADALRTKLRRLIHKEPRLTERVEVDAIDTVSERLYRAQIGSPNVATPELVQELLVNAAGDAETREFPPRFLLGEWENVVDAWQLDSWEAYRNVTRLGRKTRLPVEHRASLWTVFKKIKMELQERGLVTRSEMYGVLTERIQDHRNPPFDFAVVDEAQDISVAQLRFLAALGDQRANSLFFAGDLAQRIFQVPFSWKALGVDIQGMSETLKLNYRTSHEIRTQADRLLGLAVADVDGNVEDRRGAISAFSGSLPIICVFETVKEENEAVASWIQERREEGVGVNEIAVIVRSSNELDRARTAIGSARLPYHVLDEDVEAENDAVWITTMHRAKGLEFRAVAVIACDDEVIPLQERIETVSDDSDLEEVYQTERHLLYVACTRARDYLMVAGVKPASEFLEDLRM